MWLCGDLQADAEPLVTSFNGEFRRHPSGDSGWAVALRSVRSDSRLAVHSMPSTKKPGPGRLATRIRRRVAARSESAATVRPESSRHVVTAEVGHKGLDIPVGAYQVLERDFAHQRVE